MSVFAVCGGESPIIANLWVRHNRLAWARANNCLFTIIDDESNAKIVFEFFSGYQNSVDLKEVEHQQYLRPILDEAGICYVTISSDEFSEIIDPIQSLDFPTFLRAKVEDALATDI